MTPRIHGARFQTDGGHASARSVSPAAPAAPASLDAVLDAPCLSRRAFCALGTAALAGWGAACLAGCASTGATSAGDSAAAGQESAGANESDPADPVDPAASDPAAASGTPGAEAAASDEEPVKRSTFAFNTLVSITSYGASEADVEDVLADCAYYEDLFSARKEGTDIARVNEAAGAPVEVDPSTADLLSRALAYGAESNGAFDVTIGSVSLLWDFVEGVKPADEAIAEAVKHIDYTAVHLDGTTVTLADPQAKLDLGGIAKGWICVRLVERLQVAGATSALINLGTSSTYALGCKPDGTPWRIGLRDPKGSLASIMAVVEVADACITSSGLYDQEFELDGRTYWHILDAATGYPAETDMLGDTLVCADPVLGDALSTTLFGMGIDQGVAWIEERHPEVAAMFVDAGDDPTFANGFEDLGYQPVVSADAAQ